MPIFKNQTRRANRSAPAPFSAGTPKATNSVDDYQPILSSVERDSDDVEEVFAPQKVAHAQRSAAPGMGSLIQEETDLQSVFKSTAAEATTTPQKLVFDIR